MSSAQGVNANMGSICSQEGQQSTIQVHEVRLPNVHHALCCKPQREISLSTYAERTLESEPATDALDVYSSKAQTSQSVENVNHGTDDYANLYVVDTLIRHFPTDQEQRGYEPCISDAGCEVDRHLLGLRNPDDELDKVDPFELLRDGRPLYSLPEAFRADKEVALAAIAVEGMFCFNYIEPSLRSQDRDVVLALVRADGSLFEHICEDLRSDRELVKIALKTCSEALQFAPKSLQADKELKKLAVSRRRDEAQLIKKYAAKCGIPACLPR